MRQTIKHSFIVLLVGLVVLFLFSLRYSADQRFTLFFLNKEAANTAVILISVSYLLGPLCILVPKLARHLGYRRYFGVFGYTALVLHVLFSYIQRSGRFPFAWYLDHRIGVTAAVAAFYIFSILAFVSHNTLIKEVGSKRWKFIQRMGYIALILGLFHIYVTSSGRWSQWLQGEVSMPNSIVVFSVGIIVFVVRFLAFLHDSLSKKVHH
jgi:sulfoxide reductase heme-binding subunit YedZ